MWSHCTIISCTGTRRVRSVETRGEGVGEPELDEDPLHADKHLIEQIEMHKEALAAAQRLTVDLQQQLSEGGAGVDSRDDVNRYPS